MSLCPECNEDATRVLETRINDRGWRMRRRLCEACRNRYWTLEIPEEQLTIEDPAPEQPDEDGGTDD